MHFVSFYGNLSRCTVTWTSDSITAPDDGQRNCPKHVEFYSKNKFEKLEHFVGFYGNLSWCTVTWTSNSIKTPDDGQRNCPKHVEFYSKNKFEKLEHIVGFYGNLSLCTVTWMSNNLSDRFHLPSAAVAGKQQLQLWNWRLGLTVIL